MEFAEMLTPAEMNRWLDRSHPGNRVEYFRGHLAHDICAPPVSFSSLDERQEWREVAKDVRRLAWSWHLNGEAHLVQVRNGDDDYSYIAVRRG